MTRIVNYSVCNMWSLVPVVRWKVEIPFHDLALMRLPLLWHIVFHTLAEYNSATLLAVQCVFVSVSVCFIIIIINDTGISGDMLLSKRHTCFTMTTKWKQRVLHSGKICLDGWHQGDDDADDDDNDDNDDQ
jgi:hypothetical protein